MNNDANAAARQVIDKLAEVKRNNAAIIDAGKDAYIAKLKQRERRAWRFAAVGWAAFAVACWVRF
jgi:hypothetical protein